MRAKVLTVSDGVVAGTREDRSGAALVERLTEAGFEVVEHRVCADGAEPVANALSHMAYGFVGLIVTHRRHRLRPARHDARRAPRGARPPGVRAWPRPCGR